MNRTIRIATVLVFLQAILLACLPAPETEARPFENESVAFTIPAGWKTKDEIWGQAAEIGQEYNGLGVQELVMILYPPYPGKGSVFFAVASSPLAAGEDLESRFTQAYQKAVPEIKNASQQLFEQGGLSGYEITYERPIGEPWWRFRDIWLEKDGMIYMLSFQAYPNSFDSHADTFDQILGSFRIKD